MVRVKICGVTNESDLRAVETAGADAVGAIADVPVETPREVSLDAAAALFDAAPPFLTTTLVTMPDTVEDAVSAAQRVAPDVLQLHGGFDGAELETIRGRIAADLVIVVDAANPDRARAVASSVDAVLVDSIDDDGAGGTGETHDWEATAAVVETLDAPVILAGGLTPENVSEAVDVVRPFAVDVASGVEREGGLKDHESVRAFVANVSAAAAGIEADDERDDAAGRIEGMSS